VRPDIVASCLRSFDGDLEAPGAGFVSLGDGHLEEAVSEFSSGSLRPYLGGQRNLTGERAIPPLAMIVSLPVNPIFVTEFAFENDRILGDGHVYVLRVNSRQLSPKHEFVATLKEID
jgi:hypothetical protein